LLRLVPPGLALDFLPERLLALLPELFFGGTFFPSRLASDRPIAIACFRLVTFLPDRPLLNVPAFRFFIARPTLADAFFEYFRAMECFSRLKRNKHHALRKVPSPRQPATFDA
jgi:hypothetical protein